jgi:DNA repair protein RadA/Sms
MVQQGGQAAIAAERFPNMAKLAAAKSVEVVKTNTMELNVGETVKHGTNINDIELPEHLKITHKTGIDMLDNAFGGEGVTPSASILLSGGSGCGKTTLMLQLCDAWTKQGHIALFNTNEEAASQVKKTVLRLGLQDGFFVGQDRLVPDMLEHTALLAKKYPGRRILLVGDSLQTLDDGYYANGGTNSNTQVRVTQMMIKWAKNTHNIAVIIGQVNKNGDFAGKNMVKHAVDVHLHMFHDKAKKSETYGERILETQKNRYGYSGTEIIFGIDGRKGVYEKPNYGGEE